MKKILTLLSGVGVMATTAGAALTVVSCAGHKNLANMTAGEKPKLFVGMDQTQADAAVEAAMKVFQPKAVIEVDYTVGPFTGALAANAKVKVTAVAASKLLTGEIELTAIAKIDLSTAITDAIKTKLALAPGVKYATAKEKMLTAINALANLGLVTEANDITFTGTAIPAGATETTALTAGTFIATAKGTSQYLTGASTVNLKLDISGITKPALTTAKVKTVAQTELLVLINALTAKGTMADVVAGDLDWTGIAWTTAGNNLAAGALTVTAKADNAKVTGTFTITVTAAV
ncbi:hypothetical protein [Williamsoniiplasma luminosum]|uniref:Uncharacterized protein n=1 Tax=Williamsoniiplasma luminosum TaxID=214888 RepID=A0A2S0NLA1_9MOLU|nr:hypothetical protein [Williamsoniiplasma luminosum]AVP49784.1 MAG: hypothetical protein C5T88_04420 [Williamsoniiplasma luminosum]